MKSSLSVLLLLSLLFSALIWVNPLRTTEPDDFFANLQRQHQQNIEHQKHVSLIKFFDHYKGKKPYPINSYVTYAQQYQIDYRLLSAISVAESSAGNHACGNNWWGWQSCKGYNFASVTEGIKFVSEKLGTGYYYANKSIENKIHSYNCNPSYWIQIKGFLEEIK